MPHLSTAINAGDPGHISDHEQLHADVDTIPAPSTSVESSTAVGQTPSPGSSTAFARGDHNHGSPGAEAEVIIRFVPVAKWGTD